MGKAHLRGRFLLIPSLIALFLVQACASSGGSQVRRVPAEGYDQTQNYQFQARVRVDSLDQCQQMVVRVEALGKLYVREEPPPDRLQLFDDDCRNPIQFERARYISRQTGSPVSLSGPEVAHFLSENVRLESELFTWLFDHGL